MQSTPKLWEWIRSSKLSHETLINAYWLNTGINIEKGKMLMTQTEDEHVTEICKGCFL